MARLLANLAMQGNERETAKGNEGTCFGRQDKAFVSFHGWGRTLAIFPVRCHSVCNGADVSTQFFASSFVGHQTNLTVGNVHQ